MTPSDDRQRLSPVGRVADDRYLAGVHDVDLQGGFAYTAGKGGQTIYEGADGTGGTFGIVNVVPPTNPAVVGGLDSLRNAQTVWPAGPICYVADDDGLHAVDVTDPTRPTVVSTASAPGLTNVNAMAGWGATLFTASKAGSIHVIDVDDPASIDVVGGYETGLEAPHDVALIRGHLAVTNYDPDHVGYERPDDERHVTFLRVLDAGTVLSPSDWVETGSLTDPVLAGSNRLVARDPYVFVSTLREGAIVAAEFIDPADPAVVDSLTDVGLSVGLAGANDYLVQATTRPPPFEGFQPTVNLIDVADPTSLSIVDSITHPDPAVDFHDGEVAGATLYLTGQGTNELLLYDLGGPRVTGLEAGSVRTGSIRHAHGPQHRG